jgi:hypothetical protein
MNYESHVIPAMEVGSRFPPCRYEMHQNKMNYEEITQSPMASRHTLCVSRAVSYNRGQRMGEWVELKLLRAVAKIVSVEELMRFSMTIRVPVRSESDLVSD